MENLLKKTILVYFKILGRWGRPAKQDEDHAEHGVTSPTVKEH